MIINQLAKGGGGSGGLIVTDGIVIKTRNAEGKALTIDFYGTEVKNSQFHNQSGTSGAWNAMTDITFKNNITALGANAFLYCVALALTALPVNLTSIGMYAFRNCSALKITEIPVGVTSLGNATFMDCAALETLNCPGISSIVSGSSGASCFARCTGLTEITLGSVGHPVTSIGSSTFYECTQLGLTINIYVTAGTNPLAGSPWGATNATIKYFNAATGTEIV